MKRRRTFLTVVASCVILSGSAWVAAAGQGPALTITNQDVALVRDVRSLELTQGVQTVRIENVPKTIDPASLQVTPLADSPGFRVTAGRFVFEPVTERNLLERHIGREVQVVIPDPKGGEGARVLRTATLLASGSDGGRPVFVMEEGVYAGTYEAVIFPELTDAAWGAEPVLVWDVESEVSGRRDVEVLYLASGLSWHASYVMELTGDSDNGVLNGWVNIENRTGADFHKPRVQVASGSLHTVSMPGVRVMAAETARAPLAAGTPEALEEAEAFEYHVYRLDRPVDLPKDRTTQVPLLQNVPLTLEKRLVSRGSVWARPSARVDDEGWEQPVQVFLRFRNSAEAGGAGMPLPAGIVRAYQVRADGHAVFAGEDRLPHTAEGAEVGLEMGRSFDVRVKRKPVALERIGERVQRQTWELKATNAKDRPERLHLEETFPGEWKMLEHSHPYEAVDARRVRFSVEIPAGSEVTVRYRVELGGR